MPDPAPETNNLSELLRQVFRNAKKVAREDALEQAAEIADGWPENIAISLPEAIRSLKDKK